MSKNLENEVSLVANSLTLNAVTIEAPENVTYTLLLPTTDGTSGQFLSTDGNGVLSWVSGGGGGTVTQVAVTVPSFLSVTGSPITGAGTIAITGSSTGSGAVVLATSPTLVTPVLGAATGTSLAISGGLVSATLNGAGFTTPLASLNTTGTTAIIQVGRTLNSNGNVGQIAFNYFGANDATNEISLGFFGGVGSRLGIRNSTTTGATFNCNLTAATINSTQLSVSQAVFTDALKNLVSVAVTGTGSVVLATSPTLVTPVLGAATGTSLNLSSLTSSQAVFTDGSKNLVSVDVTGTGSVVLSTSPTLVTPTLGVASGTSLTATGNVSGSTLTSTVATGTAPITVTSTTNVANLNASFLNGATFASPGTIGGTTAGVVNATNLTASGTITGLTFTTTSGTFSAASTVSIPLPSTGIITLKLNIASTGSTVTLSGNTALNGSGSNLVALEPQEIYTDNTGGNTVTFAGTILSSFNTSTSGYVSIDFNLNRSSSFPRLNYYTTGSFTGFGGTARITGSGHLSTSSLSVTLTPSSGNLTGSWNIIKY